MAYPESLPVPQTSTVTKGERRALSDEARPREALPMQLDGMEFEELTWRPMRAAEMAVFLNWWRNELIFGGAWFAATWPLPRGMVEAVRKFVGQPRREFIPGGFWRVTATCEVRGAGVFPIEGGPSLDIIWLDNFDGDQFTPLNDHLQDIRLNGSVWAPYGETYAPRLSGTGIVGNYPGPDGESYGSSYTITYYNDEARYDLAYGWEFEVALDAMASVSDDPGMQAWTWFVIGGGQEDTGDGTVGTGLSLTFIPASTAEGAARFEFVGSGLSDIATYPLTPGEHRYKVVVLEDSYVLSLDGLLQPPLMTFGDPTPRSIVDLQMHIGAETSSETDPRPTATVTQALIRAELPTAYPVYFYQRGNGTIEVGPGGNSGIEGIEFNGAHWQTTVETTDNDHAIAVYPSSPVPTRVTNGALEFRINIYFQEDVRMSFSLFVEDSTDSGWGLEIVSEGVDPNERMARLYKLTNGTADVILESPMFVLGEAAIEIRVVVTDVEIFMYVDFELVATLSGAFTFPSAITDITATPYLDPGFEYLNSCSVKTIRPEDA